MSARKASIRASAGHRADGADWTVLFTGGVDTPPSPLENAGGTGWQLHAAEIAALDEMSHR
jgi:hypothetical protein